VKLQLISNLLGTWRNNSSRLEKNAVLLRLALIAQTIAFVLLGAVVYGVYHIYTATPDPKSKAFITEKEISLFKDSTEYIKNYVAKVKKAFGL